MVKKMRGLGKGFFVLSALLLMFLAVGCDDSDSTDAGANIIPENPKASVAEEVDLIGELDPVGGITDSTGAETKVVVTVPEAGTAKNSADETVEAPKATITVADQATVKSAGIALPSDEGGEGDTVVLEDGKEFVAAAGAKVESDVKYYQLDDNDEDTTAEVTVTIPGVNFSDETQKNDFLSKNDFYVSYMDKNEDDQEVKKWVKLSAEKGLTFNFDGTITIDAKDAGLKVGTKLFMPVDIVAGTAVTTVEVTLEVTPPTKEECNIVATASVGNTNAVIDKIVYKHWTLSGDSWGSAERIKKTDSADYSYSFMAPLSEAASYKIQAEVYYTIDGKSTMKQTIFNKIEDAICETGATNV